MQLVWDEPIYSRGAYSQSGSHRQSIGYKILVRLRLNFDLVTTNSAMTHVLVLSSKVRRSELLKWAVMIDSRHWQYVHTNFWLQEFIVLSIQGLKLPNNLQSSLFLSSYMWENCIALYFSKFDAKHLKWLVIGAYFRMIFVQTSPLTPSMHWKLTKYGKFMYAKQPTPDQVSSCIISLISFVNFTQNSMWWQKSCSTMSKWLLSPPQMHFIVSVWDLRLLRLCPQIPVEPCPLTV